MVSYWEMIMVGKGELSKWNNLLKDIFWFDLIGHVGQISRVKNGRECVKNVG